MDHTGRFSFLNYWRALINTQDARAPNPASAPMLIDSRGVCSLRIATDKTVTMYCLMPESHNPGGAGSVCIKVSVATKTRASRTSKGFFFASSSTAPYYIYSKQVYWNFSSSHLRLLGKFFSIQSISLQLVVFACFKLALSLATSSETRPLSNTSIGGSILF
ncbi:hypothetical protein BS78_03G207900 [Paspalum vaginatum]|nr:hypothetical protein BS78_03G207900 [Paspalum vaginatum]